MSELKSCPFCGGKALYEGYHNVDGFDMPFMFCNWCKSMFTVEGSEDWVHGNRDGMGELRAAWNRRAGHTANRVKVPREGHTSIGHYECGECHGVVGAQDAYCKHCGAKLVEP